MIVASEKPIERTVVIAAGRVSSKKFAEAQLIEAEHAAEQEVHAREVTKVDDPKPLAPTFSLPLYSPPARALGFRIFGWCFSFATRQRTIRGWLLARLAFVQWLGRFANNAEKWFNSVKYGKVTKEVKEARDDECAHCTTRLVRIVQRPSDVRKGRAHREKVYCGSCGCGEWSGAELKNKNWWWNWRCPEGKHQGNYPGESYMKLVAQSMAERKAYFEAQKKRQGNGGCNGGCGGKAK